ncbi:MAG: hypothetical protein K9J06_00900 [Flavobacteriales bacterium]|nr:hypothetical protein [Flavobacteriales bacterium]
MITVNEMSGHRAGAWSRYVAILLLCVPCLAHLHVNAQDQEAGKGKKIRIMGKFEGRNAFVRTHHALFLGARLGVEFKFPVRAGLGYYWMQTEITSQLYDPKEHPGNGDSAIPRMRYVMAYVEYTFWEEDGWALGVPVQIGMGETFYRTSTDAHVGNGLVMPLELGVDVSYQFSRWAGLGVGLGYRVMLMSNDEVKENLNSPYYQVRLGLAVSEIFKKRVKK